MSDFSGETRPGGVHKGCAPKIGPALRAEEGVSRSRVREKKIFRKSRRSALRIPEIGSAKISGKKFSAKIQT